MGHTRSKLWKVMKVKYSSDTWNLNIPSTSRPHWPKFVIVTHITTIMRFSVTSCVIKFYFLLHKLSVTAETQLIRSLHDSSWRYFLNREYLSKKLGASGQSHLNLVRAMDHLYQLVSTSPACGHFQLPQGTGPSRQSFIPVFTNYKVADMNTINSFIVAHIHKLSTAGARLHFRQLSPPPHSPPPGHHSLWSLTSVTAGSDTVRKFQPYFSVVEKYSVLFPFSYMRQNQMKFLI